MCRACALFVLMMFIASLQADASESTAKPAPKKLIEFGWDEPDPAFLRKQIVEMEKTPFDGCVFHPMYTNADGSQGNFTWECWGKRAFTEKELNNSLEDLKATPIRRFTENFLRFNTTPADVDWFDEFSAILNNARLAARIAREGKCRGLLFDIEQYNAPLFNYRRQRDAETKPWEVYADQVRLRGRQVMEAFQQGFPDLVIFLTFGYSLPWTQSQNGARLLSDCSYGLLAPFLDGMVDASEGRTRIVDGHELSYGFRDSSRFAIAYKTMKEGVLPIVRDAKKYHEVFSFGFGIWLDHDWRNRGWDTEDLSKNFFTPEAIESSARAALQAADEYVWIYTETPRWWSADGKRVKLPDAYDLALRRARGLEDPNFILNAADTMEKVFRDEPWSRTAASRLTVEAVKNGVEGIQLVVSPSGKKDLQGVTIELTDLVSEGGSAIAGSNITWRVVGYVETEKPAYAVKTVGWWPDPLHPSQPFDVKPGSVQPIWISIRTPENEKAGVYRGMVKVRSENGRPFTRMIP